MTMRLGIFLAVVLALVAPATAQTRATPNFTIAAPPANDNSGLIANTAFVRATLSGAIAALNKASVGLGNVDNTSDAAKPISTAAQAALDLKAPLASPTFTGTGTFDTLSTAGSASIGGSAIVGNTASQYPSGLIVRPSLHSSGSKRAQVAIDNWLVLQDQGGTGTKDFALFNVIAGVTPFQISTANVATFSARPVFGTATPWDSGNFNPALYAPLASPALTGAPSAPTATAGTSTTQIATTEFAANSATAAAASRAAYTDWIAYSPTVGCVSGSYGTAPTVTARYARIGNVVQVSARINTAASGNGTCAGGITLPLPVPAANGAFLAGREGNVSGKMLQASASSTVASVFNYDNTYPGGNNTSLFVSGSYEVSP